MGTSPVITVFVRHSADCKYKGDEFCRRCKCRKHLRWTLNGKQHREKTGTRSWEGAEQAKRRMEDQLGGRSVEPEHKAELISDALTLFLQDKQVRGVSSGVLSRYKSELGRFQAYCESKGVFTVQLVTRELLTGYAATWESTYASSNTRAGVRERLRGFLRYCYEAQWLDRIPPVPRVQADEAPT